MKKVSVFFRIVFTTMLILSLAVVPVLAAGVEGTEISLVNDESGYKIIVPGFVDVRTETVYDQEVSVLVMKTPNKDSNGKYPIFEVVTTDKKADSIFSFAGIVEEGQIAEVDKPFKDGRLMFDLAISSDLKSISKDKIFSFDFTVYDKDINEIYVVENLYVIFDDNAKAAESQDKPKAEEPAKAAVATANPTSSKVMVDGKSVAFEAYNIGGNNYFKLRDLAMAVNGSSKQFQVGWDSAKNAINLTSNTAYTPDGKELVVSGNKAAKQAKLTASKIYLNNEEVQLTAYNIDGNNYFKLRDIGKIIDFAVTWDGSLNMIGLDTASSYVEE
jgi:hypothetical protein